MLLIARLRGRAQRGSYRPLELPALGGQLRATLVRCRFCGDPLDIHYLGVSDWRSGSKRTISSMRLMNWPVLLELVHHFAAGSGVDSASGPATPQRLGADVGREDETVFLKSTVRPWPSVRRLVGSAAAR